MIQTMVLYPKPEETYEVKGERPLTWLKEGEYDLVNLSLIGHDPVTGRTYEECQDEWDRWMAETKNRVDQLRWWQARERFRVATAVAMLRQRKGMG